MSKDNFFTALIDELIQCNFLTKTTPELQSYRGTEEVKKEPPIRTNGAHRSGSVISEKRLCEEVTITTEPSDSRPQTSLFLRLREAARACWGDRGASLVGAAYYKNGLDEDEILEVMRYVVMFRGEANELAHGLWISGDNNANTW